MEILKTFGCGLIFLLTVWILFFMASLGWHEARQLADSWFQAVDVE